MMSPTTPTKGEILLVDDTLANLHLLSQILSDEGYTVRPASNGTLALRAVESSLPDLILLDIKMPGINGYDVCKTLKENDRTRLIPVIFISTLGEVLDKVKAFALGGVDYITKPFHTEEVIARINTQFNLLKLQRELIEQKEQLAQQNYRLQLEIQERIATEKALKESEEIFSKAFLSSPNPITITLLATGQHLAVNEAFLRQTGYSREEAIGSSAIDLNLWVNLEERVKLFQQLEEQGAIHNFEFTSRRKDGRHRTTLLSAEQIVLRGQPCLLTFSNDITERKRKEEALHLIVEGTASTTGEECLRSCVRYLAEVLQVRYAAVTQWTDGTPKKMRSLAFWAGDRWLENRDYEPVGTPCEKVAQGEYCYYPDRLLSLFPDAQILIDLNIVSYCGIPLVNTSGDIVGNLMAFDDRPMPEDLVRELILKIFAARISAELERTAAETELVKKSKALAESETRYATATTESLVGVWDWNVETDEIYLSSNLKTMLGYKEDEIPNRLDAWYSLSHPDDREAAREAAEAHLRGLTSVYECEHRTIHKNSSIHWILVRGTAFRDGNGKPYRMMGTATDITQLKQVEVALQRRERYLSTLVEVQSQLLQAKNLRDCYGDILECLGLASRASRVYIFENHRDNEGNLLMSQRAEWCSPGVQSEINNPSLQNLSYEESFPRWQQILSKGEIIEGLVSDFPDWERDILEPQGIVSILIFPLLCDGEFFGFIGFDNCDTARTWEGSEIDLLKAAATAISLWQERKRAAEALEKAKEAAEIANQTKSQFLASMSHELRTPLNAILGFTQLLAREQYVDRQGKEYLEIISRSGQHLLNLINDILDMSKIEAGRITLDVTGFDVYRLINTLEDMFYPLAQNKGLRLFIQRGMTVPQYIKSDESKLRQILINLLGNAIKFTEQGSVGLTIDYQMYTVPSLSFAVEDTGIGIAPEDMKCIFEPFVQKPYNSNHLQEGTGLGLPISRQFVRLLGGELEVASVTQQGSLFSFWIPVTLADADGCIVMLAAQRTLGLAPHQPIYRILIVEDRWTNRKLLRKIIEPLGFEVREAVDGEAAIALWQSWQPHLIWMDLRMPIVDGYEATREIRRRERDTHQQPCKIIALSANAFKDTKEKLLAIGCDDFVAKPFKEEILLQKMAEYLGVQYLSEFEQPSKLTHLLVDEITPLLRELMSDDWLDRLYKAAIKGSDEVILALIEEIPSSQQPLKDTLTHWTDRYCFDKLLEVTK